MSAGGPCDPAAGARPPLSGRADSVVPFSEYTETGDVVILVMELGVCPGRVLIPTWEIYFHRITDSQISFCQCLHLLRVPSGSCHLQ